MKKLNKMKKILFIYILHKNYLKLNNLFNFFIIKKLIMNNN